MLVKITVVEKQGIEEVVHPEVWLLWELETTSKRGCSISRIS